MKRLMAAAAGLALVTILSPPGLSEDRVPGASIRDRIQDRMEKKRLERVPRLGSAANTPGAKPGYESIVIHGYVRTFMRYTPNAVLVAGKRSPVVFALHGAMSTADKIQGYLGLNAVADREGFVVVYPQGDNNRWNDGPPARLTDDGDYSAADDVGFLTGLADALVVQGVADPKHLYLTGVSNGGFMALRLACSQTSPFAAIGTVIASMPADAAAKCKPSGLVPLIMINGTDDEIVRFDGGNGKFGVSGNAPPMDVASSFATRSGCKTATETQLPDADPKDSTTVVLRAWTGCYPGGAVEFYTVKGGGHQAPAIGPKSGGVLLDTFGGTRSHDIDSAETIWKFFKRF